MAKSKKGGGKSGLLGPLYTAPDGYELGPHRVEGPKGGKAIPDPLGFGHGHLGKGPAAQKHNSQSHDKD